ncbi:protein Wiz-like [Sarcophilus harrisii]|uniref:protein Wiz-like n=1 Tax=Sarcophilus harrisii TaxID=9305 RepID=UPI001301D232|nr:protein Wiz-like [Sarcophilus harrisii]
MSSEGSPPGKPGPPAPAQTVVYAVRGCFQEPNRPLPPYPPGGFLALQGHLFGGPHKNLEGPRAVTPCRALEGAVPTEKDGAQRPVLQTPLHSLGAQVRTEEVEIKRQTLVVGLQDKDTHLMGRVTLRGQGTQNLASWAEPVRGVHCQLCGELFKDRRGLSCHVRSHIRRMGVTKWYGSPIVKLEEVLEKRANAGLVKKEPTPAELPCPRGEDGPRSTGKGLCLSLRPHCSHNPGKPGLALP